jgi:UDP-2,3-diacylglucosamine hydrolase
LSRLTVISDLHLPVDPDPVRERFLALLSELGRRQRSGQTQQLVVAGDLFSFWVDRPLVARRFEPALGALARLVNSGCQVTLIEGNRDFGFGRVLSSASGAALCKEELRIDDRDARALVLHGDQFLTADRRYQLFKKLVRSGPARLAARLLPSPLLLWSVRRLEAASRREKARKPPEHMQADDRAIARTATAAGAQVVIHGHTHQPAAREIRAAGGPLKCFSLGQWDSAGAVILDWPEAAPPRLVHWPSGEPFTAS